VGAFVAVWDPATEFGSIVRQTSAATTNDNAIISFSDFMEFSLSGLGYVGHDGKSAVFRSWPDFRGTLIIRG
jgi:hypothetical protein